MIVCIHIHTRQNPRHIFLDRLSVFSLSRAHLTMRLICPCILKRNRSLQCPCFVTSSLSVTYQLSATYDITRAAHSVIVMRGSTCRGRTVAGIHTGMLFCKHLFCELSCGPAQQLCQANAPL